MEKLDVDIDIKRIAKNCTAYLQLVTMTEDQRLFAALFKVNFLKKKIFFFEMTIKFFESASFE